MSNGDYRSRCGAHSQGGSATRTRLRSIQRHGDSYFSRVGVASFTLVLSTESFAPPANDDVFHIGRGIRLQGRLYARGAGIDKIEIWPGDAARMYAQAATQWDPSTAVPWKVEFELPVEVEDAVMHVMTCLIENETAAMVASSRFVAQMCPHFREVMQVSAIQAADEARHIEVFTRRASVKRKELGLSNVGGQASLADARGRAELCHRHVLVAGTGRRDFSE